MEVEKREMRLTVKELDEIMKCFGSERSCLFDYYRESAGFEGWTNFETFTAYQNLCNDDQLFRKWGPQAKSLLNESVYRTYGGKMTPYETARMSLAETMKHYFKSKVDEKWTLEPINRELLKGAYDVVNWYELVDVLMEDVPQSIAAEPSESSNVLQLPLPPPNTKPRQRSKKSRESLNDHKVEP